MKKFAFILVSIFLASGCAHTRAPVAIATLQPTEGNTAKGTVHFTDAGDGNFDMQVDLTGVPPGVHGFHIHAKGDCGNNAMNAGGHFNPTSMVHGAPDAVSHHAGDFGNVTADANGEVHAYITTHFISLKAGEPTNPVGHAVVLHEKADDMISQPAGNAGSRIACGVIETVSAHP